MARLRQFKFIKARRKIRKNKQGEDCGSCERIIWLHNEVDGELHRDEIGRPICAVCRVQKSAIGDTIKADKDKYLEQKSKQENEEIRKELDKVVQIAHATQKATKTKMKKSK